MKTKIIVISLFLSIFTSCSSHEETNTLVNPPFLNEEMANEVSE
jgi:hypothetical protein